jgi:hypothetical protein
MPIVPLFGLGQEGKSPVVTAQRHLNLYAEMTPGSEKGQFALYGTPGLALFTSFGSTPVRGGLAYGDYIYYVHRGTFWQVDNSGAKVSRGTIGTTSGRVEMACNGQQVGIVDGDNMYCYTIATHAFAIVSSGLFADPIGITYQDGRFIVCFADSGQFQISALYDGTTFDALDFATAESSPDNLLRVMADHGEIVMCGDSTVEFWGNSGGQDFPYSNIRGATLEFGLAAPWSLVKYNDSLAGLFRNRMGQVQVMMMAGHALQKLSTPEIDSLINSYGVVSDATAYAYMLGGHPMFQLNFPSADKSWLYDATTQLWSSLESGLSGGRHRGEIHLDFLNKPRVTDYESGNVYTIDPDTYTDNGLPIPREIITRHMMQNFKRQSISSLQVDMETGVGLVSGQGDNPQVMLQISKDNGRTWGNELWRPMGKIGQYYSRVVWRRLGMAYDWVFKLRITDPVKVVLCSASIETSGGLIND